MLEAGKGLGERSGDIERRTELDFLSFFSGHGLSSMHLYLYQTRSNPPTCVLSAEHHEDCIFHEGQDNESVLL